MTPVRRRRVQWPKASPQRSLGTRCCTRASGSSGRGTPCSTGWIQRTSFERRMSPVRSRAKALGSPTSRRRRAGRGPIWSGSSTNSAGGSRRRRCSAARLRRVGGRRSRRGNQVSRWDARQEHGGESCPRPTRGHGPCFGAGAAVGNGSGAAGFESDGYLRSSPSTVA